MALTSENSYVSAEEAQTYIAVQGLVPLSDPEGLIKRATNAIDRIYGPYFTGVKASESQTLMWPRSWTGSYDAHGNPLDLSGVPVAVKDATIELAVMLDAGVNPYAQPEPTVISETNTVDVLTVSKSYDNSGYRSDPLYKISLILRPVMKAAGQVRLVR